MPVRDGGVFARGFDAELDELRALSENAGQFLVDLEARERARTGKNAPGRGGAGRLLVPSPGTPGEGVG